MKNKKRLLAVIIVILFIISIAVVLFEKSGSEKEIVGPAPVFTAKDVNGTEISLNDVEGKFVILQIMRLDSYTCEACEEHIDQQLKELEKFYSTNKEDVEIITLNMRFDEDEDTKFMVRDLYKVDWYLVDEYIPWPIASEYKDYWSDKSGIVFHNPTIVLIDTDLNIVGVYHIDEEGVLDSKDLSFKIEKIQEGSWGDYIEGKKGRGGVSFIGIFGLGMITALSPCSIALLIAVLSYVGSMGEEKKKKDAKRKYDPEESSWTGFWIGISFTLGMALIFFIFGCLISYIGFFVKISIVFYLFAGIILVILGINAIKSIKESYMSLIERIRPDRTSDEKAENQSRFDKTGMDIITRISGKSIFLGAFFLGILFAVGWAPCALSLTLPVLILILTQNVPILVGGLMLFVFGLGHGIPIIPLCTFTRGIRAKIGNKYVTAGKWLEKIFGIIIIIIGIILMLRCRGINFW